MSTVLDVFVAEFANWDRVCAFIWVVSLWATCGTWWSAREDSGTEFSVAENAWRLACAVYLIIFALFVNFIYAPFLIALYTLLIIFCKLALMHFCTNLWIINQIWGRRSILFSKVCRRLLVYYFWLCFLFLLNSCIIGYFAKLFVCVRHDEYDDDHDGDKDGDKADN